MSTTTRMHGLIQITANANGYAWVYLNPQNTNVIDIDTEAATNMAPSGTTTSITRFASVNTHPLYQADLRVVSAGIRLFLTTPYINSTGMFIGSAIPYSGSWDSAELYDRLGDSPRKVIAQASDIMELIWTPRDVSDQNFVGYTSQKFNNTLIAVFQGLASSVVTLEYDINYEVIPRSYVDAFVMNSSPSGDPAVTSKLISTMPDATARVTTKGVSWLKQNASNISKAWSNLVKNPGPMIRSALSALGPLAI